MRVKMVKLNLIDEQLHINFQGLSKCKATQSLRWSNHLMMERNCAVFCVLSAPGKNDCQIKLLTQYCTRSVNVEFKL